MAGLLTRITTLSIRCLLYLVLVLLGCSENGNKVLMEDNPVVDTGGIDSSLVSSPSAELETVELKKSIPDPMLQSPGVPIATEDIMQFAESLLGIPYRYASSDPAVGFDCSGFITYVFNHFDLTVPRSSIGFTDLGAAIREEDVTRGDVILFTGTNPQETFVGHMGLITSHDDKGILFIHSTSGKANAVTVTPLNDYYRKRLVGFRRIL